MLNKIEEIMQELHLDIFENLTGQTNKEYFEGKVNSLLNEITNERVNCVRNYINNQLNI